MAREPIRGDVSGQENIQMLMGQIRKLFDPHWLQVFDNGRFTVQFQDEPDAEEELIRFVDMYGYDMTLREDRTWVKYHFE